jgi:hypothetical protein
MKLSTILAIHAASVGFGLLPFANGQIVTYRATYSLSGSSSDFLSATTDLTIDTSAAQATDNQLYSNFDPTAASWVRGLVFNFDTTSGNYQMSLGIGLANDITSMSWQSPNTSPINPTIFNFTGNNTDYSSTFSVSGQSPTTLNVTLGSSSYTLNQTSFSAVPEPEEWAAIASGGLLAFGIWHRRSRKAKKA